MYEPTDNGLAPTGTPRRTAQWLLIWPVVFAVVMFASLNPVACLIHCAAQSQHQTTAPHPSNVYLCVVDDLTHLLAGTGSTDPNTLVPRAVHELVLDPRIVLAVALVLLFRVCAAHVRSPFRALVPPNPPPKFA